MLKLHCAQWKFLVSMFTGKMLKDWWYGTLDYNKDPSPAHVVGGHHADPG